MAKATIKSKSGAVVTIEGSEKEVASILATFERVTAVGHAKEVLTKTWTDWIDYWSVDFDFESKKEIIRVKDEATGETVEKWTGDFIFENEWQSFRTKKDRSLELTSAAREVDKKRVKIAVKVVDIFGNDTMTIVDVAVGGKK